MIIPGYTTQVTLADASIASLSGSSQTLLSVSDSRQFIVLIENTGNANVAVCFTGAASIGGKGCVTIVPNGSLLFDRVIPQNAITVIGTAGQPVTCLWA